MPEDKMNQLISEMIDGTISQEDRELLLTAMEENSSVRDLYTEIIQFDSMLHCEDKFMVQVPASLQTESNFKKLRKQLIFTRYMLTSAVVLCACLIGYQWMTGVSSVVNASVGREGEPVAVLSRIHDVEWKPVGIQPVVEEAIYPGWLELKKGRATVGMLNGTNILLNGEVRLGLNAHHRASLQSGEISVYSPEGKSIFTLALPWGNIETKGSLFQIVHNDKSGSDINVMSGSVQIFLNQNKKIDQTELSQSEVLTLSKNHGVRISVREKEGQEIKEVVQYELNEKHSVATHSLNEIRHPQSFRKITFSDDKLKSFDIQDGQYSLPTSYSISENGNHIKLSGNAWKYLDINSEIQSDSVLEFDFKSTQEGQIHGIGFSNDGKYGSGNPLFQVYGYEYFEHIHRQFNHYEGSDWQHFQIPIGLYLKGKYKYLVLVADEDVMANAESQFRNIKISVEK